MSRGRFFDARNSPCVCTGPFAFTFLCLLCSRKLTFRLLPSPLPFRNRYSATEMYNPCYSSLANAMGGTGFKLADKDDLEKVVADFLACDGPCVLDALCEKEEHVYPMVPAGKGLHEMVLPPSQTGSPSPDI